VVHRRPRRISFLDLVVLASVLSLVISGALFAKTLSGLGVIILCVFILGSCFPRWYRERRYRGLGLAQVDGMSGREFEHYVAKLLASQGYKVRVTPSSGDLGVDVVASKGHESYAVQVKRHASKLSRTSVSDAVAGRVHYRCTKAMVVTNSFFSPGAVQLAESTECVLVDRDTLARWVDQFRG
jgi:restriction system protein